MLYQTCPWSHNPTPEPDPLMICPPPCVTNCHIFCGKEHPVNFTVQE